MSNRFCFPSIKGNSHFGLEHAVQINEFLDHNSDEGHYFMLLVQIGRAGSVKLKRYYETQILTIQKNRHLVRERIKAKEDLSSIDQMTYYSEWYYAAIHVMLSVTQFQTKLAIAQALNLPLSLVTSCLEFLVSKGLASEKDGRFKIGATRIHLGPDSPMISRFHSNWRLRALQAMELKNPESLHYSTVISLSERDVQKIRSVLLEAIERTEKIFKPSKEEAVFCAAMDFFRVC